LWQEWAQYAQGGSKESAIGADFFTPLVGPRSERSLLEKFRRRARVRVNEQIAARLEEAAHLFREQGADPFRVAAYLRAASTVRSSHESLDELFRQRGLEGLKELPNVGESIGRAIRELLTHGRLPMLDRLRGEANPIALLRSVPGIGRVFAERLHDELGLETLADLEAAAHDGRLETIAGFGAKRLAGIRDSLAQRLGRVRLPSGTEAPPRVSELLDVDREYRDKAAAGQLQRIAPRRFNPAGEAWLPVLHTRRGSRRYTALFSNTPRAHRAGKTRDWVVLYSDDGVGERRHTVITAAFGPLRGCRVVAGREDECMAVYKPGRAAAADDSTIPETTGNRQGQ
jgi:putative hydrolase